MTEHYQFLVPGRDYIRNYLQDLVHLRIVTAALVQDKGTVAHHPHLGQEQKQPSPVSFAEKMVFLPLENDSCDCSPELLMKIHLLTGHNDEEILVHPTGKLKIHVSLTAAQEHRGQRVGDGIQSRITCYLSGRICQYVIVSEQVIWSKYILVNKLDYGIQLLKFILQRSAG